MVRLSYSTKGRRCPRATQLGEDNLKINSCPAVSATIVAFAMATLPPPASAATTALISGTEGPWSRDEFYMGAAAGAAFNAGATDWQAYGYTAQNSVDTLSNKAASSVFTGGIYAGWMHRFESAPVVLGPEVDINYLGNFRSNNNVTIDLTTSSIPALNGTYYLSTGRSANYYGTVVGHLGYVIDNIQLYLSGGFAYAGNSGAKETTVIFTPQSGGASRSYTGNGSNQSHWGSAFGVGGEYAINSAIAARLDYSYVSLKNSNITLSDPNGGGQYYIVNNIKEHFSVVRLGVTYSF